MSVYDSLTTDLTPALDGAWAAVIAESVASVNDMAKFVIPAFEKHLVFGPCPWQPRPARLSQVSPAAVAAITGSTTVADLKAATVAAFDLDLDLLPQKGDACLVVFDNNGDPWIVAWWPS